MSIDIAVIPVAGRGTRLLPLTKSQPKEMLPVGRKPVVQYVVEELAHSGIQKLLFITGPDKGVIENHFDIQAELIQHLRETHKEELLGELDFDRNGLAYLYTRQRRQLGLGHAVLCARPLVRDSAFVVALGDSLIGPERPSTVVGRLIELFETMGAEAAIAFEEVPWNDVAHYGIAQPRGEAGEVFELADLVEKPHRADAPSNLAIAARYVLAPSVFDALERTDPGKGNEIQLTDALRLVLQDGGKIVGLRLAEGETRFDVGSFDSYFRAFAAYALADPEHGEAVRRDLERLLNQCERLV